jgi:hypothetical protein
MAESWDNKTKATVQKIPLLTVCAPLAATAAAPWTAQVLLEPVTGPRYDSINAEVMLIRTVELLGPFEEQICSF